MGDQELNEDQCQDEGQNVGPDGEEVDGSKAGDPPATVVLVIGMAGSGKTTLMQRLNSHLHMNDTPAFAINLDPAVLQVCVCFVRSPMREVLVPSASVKLRTRHNTVIKHPPTFAE